MYGLTNYFFFLSFIHTCPDTKFISKEFSKKILREFPWLIDYKIEFGEKSIMKIVSFTRGDYEIPGKNAD